MSHKLLQSTAVTGGMTLLSRVSGLVRDVIFAKFLGASIGPAADAFYIAFRIPNMFRRFFGEGAFSQAFVPVMSEYTQKGDAKATRVFVSHMTGRFAILLFVITLVGVVGAPLLAIVITPGWFTSDPGKYQLTTDLLRITFPYLFFISLVALAAGVLNAHGRFAAAAVTPVLLNLALIAAALWAAPYFDPPVMALAWGVFAAGVLQLGFQAPFLVRMRMLPPPRAGQHEGVSKVFRLMLPAIFGSSVSQLNMVVNSVLASFLVTGSVSWLYYSDRLMEFPLGVFGIALATVLLPSLSGEHVTGDGERFSQLLDWGLRLVVMIAVPAAAALIVLAGPMVATIFHYGAFLEIDVVRTMQALWVYAAGLVGFVLVKVLAPGFYARKNTRTPAKVAMVTFGINIALSLALIYPLKFIGLALSVSLAAYVNAVMLYVLLRKHGHYVPGHGWWRLTAQVAFATAAMAGVLYWGAGDLKPWLAAGMAQRVLWLAGWIVAGLAVYAVALLAVGIRPADLRSPARRSAD